MLNFQVVIFKFQIKIYHKRPSPAPPAAKKGWRWMAFSDGSQYHDWIRQEKKMLFPKKTLVYLVQYSIRTSNLWRLPHVRQTTKKKTVPPPPTPKIRNVGGSSQDSTMGSWNSIMGVHQGWFPKPTTPRLQGGFAAVAFRRDSGRSTIPWELEFCGSPMLGVGKTHLGNWIWCPSIISTYR